jgi:hypothetical protein
MNKRAAQALYAAEAAGVKQLIGEATDGKGGLLRHRLALCTGMRRRPRL